MKKAATEFSQRTTLYLDDFWEYFQIVLQESPDAYKELVSELMRKAKGLTFSIYDEHLVQSIQNNSIKLNLTSFYFREAVTEVTDYMSMLFKEKNVHLSVNMSLEFPLRVISDKFRV